MFAGRALLFGLVFGLTTSSGLGSRPTLPALVFVPEATIRLGSDVAELVEAASRCNREAGATICTPETFASERRDDRTVTVANFLLDRTEVSRRDYLRCVRAGRCGEPFEPAGEPRASGELPVVGVDHREASAFCAFVQKRLPTEDEWERAARGPERRTYPWGFDFHRGRVNGGRFGPEKTDSSDGYELWAPVSSLADGRTPEGVLQLSGNVEEWTETPGRETTGTRVIRGGHFASPPSRLRAGTRSAVPMTTRRPTLGFRCAKSLAP